MRSGVAVGNAAKRLQVGPGSSAAKQAAEKVAFRLAAPEGVID
jgi:hypothetical protein